MASKVFGPRNLHAFSLQRCMLDETFRCGPFNLGIQRRWKKPVDSARTRLEGRTRDHRLDKLMIQLKNLRLALDLHEVISQQRNGYASLQLLLRWRHEIGLNTEIGAFLKKYPHIFEIFVHPVKRNHCCRITQKMADLVAEEDAVIRENEPAIVQRLKKLLMMSGNGTLNLHALWLIRKELGLPDDYRCTILPNHRSEFSLETPDTLTLISRDENLAVANIEGWREKEYTEKWLAEYETKYAFPINFPTGFKIEKGLREKLKNWQRLPYTKPYEKNDLHPISNVERLEKRIVGILHELLSSTVEKMIPLERLSHFRRPFSMELGDRGCMATLRVTLCSLLLFSFLSCECPTAAELERAQTALLQVDASWEVTRKIPQTLFGIFFEVWKLEGATPLETYIHGPSLGTNPPYT